MVEPVRVDDADDPRLTDFFHLGDPDLRRRTEAEGGFFVAEGPLVVRALLASGRRVRAVLVTPAQQQVLAADLVGLEAPVYVAPPDVVRATVGFDLHRGAVASADRFALPDPVDLLATARRVAVLEQVNDHENLGGIFRNAAAFGIDAVLLCPRCSDPLYRRAVRVSIGHVLRVPFARLGPWPAGLDTVREAGFVLVALTPDRTAESINSFRPARDDRVALLFGAEGQGLSADALRGADRRLRIPLRPAVDSLNVASAAAVAFHLMGAAEIDLNTRCGGAAASRREA